MNTVKFKSSHSKLKGINENQKNEIVRFTNILNFKEMFKMYYFQIS